MRPLVKSPSVAKLPNPYNGIHEELRLHVKGQKENSIYEAQKCHNGQFSLASPDEAGGEHFGV